MKMVFVNETDSTNSYIKQVAADSKGETLVVWTDFQTAGRGCGTNSWESEPGKNLTFSIMVRPQHIAPRDQFILSMAHAVALKRTLSQYIDDVRVKWPNDIYWRDSKLCGTLIETTLEAQHIKTCIIGTGINVNQQVFRSDAPNPVSLCQILGHEMDRETILHRVAELTDELVSQAADGGAEAIRDEYRSALYRRGEIHPYRLPSGEQRMLRLDDVSDDGHLLLFSADSKEHLAFAFKEVQFVLDERWRNLETTEYRNTGITE